MQVHTREAIKKKALIPICNCFSISTGLLTGPKSGNTFISTVRVRVSVYLMLSIVCVRARVREYLFHPRRTRVYFKHTSRNFASVLDSLDARHRLPKTARRERLFVSWGALIVNKRRTPTIGKRISDVSACTASSRRWPNKSCFAYINVPRCVLSCFSTKLVQYGLPLYAHHAATAIFRASTQFFRARYAALFSCAALTLSYSPTIETYRGKLKMFHLTCNWSVMHRRKSIIFLLM